MVPNLEFLWAMISPSKSAGIFIITLFEYYSDNANIALTEKYLTLKIIYFSYGICNAGIIPSYHRSALLVPKEFSGIALGITNMFSVLLGAVCIQLVGFLINVMGAGNSVEHNIHSPLLYQKIFILLLVSFTICLILSCFMKHLSKS